MKQSPVLCLLLLTFGAISSPGAEGLKMSMPQRKVYTNRLSQQHNKQSHTTIKGRLGHLRPRLWYGATTCVEEASPTSLQAALKFKNFEDMIKNFRDTLIVVFSADLCGPCRLMKKELHQVSEEIGDDVKIVAIDTERFPKLGARYDISVLPTIVIFKDGEAQERIEGLETAEQLLERLRTLQ
jgi:thiol-disulfide isomerase/thioredoxin